MMEISNSHRFRGVIQDHVIRARSHERPKLLDKDLPASCTFSFAAEIVWLLLNPHLARWPNVLFFARGGITLSRWAADVS